MNSKTSFFHTMIRIALLYSFLLCAFTAVTITAQIPLPPYTTLAPLPGTTENCTGNTCTTTFPKYLPGLFNFSIGLAALLAFVMISYGGFEYMTTDAISGKGDARNKIQNAIGGLLLVIGAYAILYTINPQILNFDLNIEKPDLKNLQTGVLVLDPLTGQVISGGGTGCQGTCPYSYKNSAGVAVNYQTCSTCTSATSFGLKIKTTTVNGTAAQIDTDLGNKLKAVNSTPGTPAFQVTETWPPTVNHAEQGQYNGTSVDVGLINPNAASIKTFITNSNNQGLRVVYEVKTPAQRQAYIDAGVPAANLLVVTYATGEHFSVYKK